MCSDFKHPCTTADSVAATEKLKIIAKMCKCHSRHRIPVQRPRGYPYRPHTVSQADCMPVWGLCHEAPPHRARARRGGRRRVIDIVDAARPAPPPPRPRPGTRSFQGLKSLRGVAAPQHHGKSRALRNKQCLCQNCTDASYCCY